jgi:hypothetical protein
MVYLATTGRRSRTSKRRQDSAAKMQRSNFFRKFMIGNWIRNKVHDSSVQKIPQSCGDTSLLTWAPMPGMPRPSLDHCSHPLLNGYLG